jgi:hypothetical protein
MIVYPEFRIILMCYKSWAVLGVMIELAKEF